MHHLSAARCLYIDILSQPQIRSGRRFLKVREVLLTAGVQHIICGVVGDRVHACHVKDQCCILGLPY